MQANKQVSKVTSSLLELLVAAKNQQNLYQNLSCLKMLPENSLFYSLDYIRLLSKLFSPSLFLLLGKFAPFHRLDKVVLILLKVLNSCRIQRQLGWGLVTQDMKDQGMPRVGRKYSPLSINRNLSGAIIVQQNKTDFSISPLESNYDDNVFFYIFK